jgi:hypothetical protein
MKMGGRGAKKVNLENWENLEKGGVTLYPKIYNILCDISLLTISSNRLVSHYLKMYIYR